MERLTIGAFARASRLSPKALRLYDELGLLPPAEVDPATGYRFYDPAQLARARLVAWLRRLGMPLAQIREVCELEPAATAEAVRAFWSRVEADILADIAERRELAAFLIEQLTEEETTMPKSMDIRYAVLSDTGLVRPTNQDAGHADARLLAVADGFGQEGAPASAAAIEALRNAENEVLESGDLLNALADAIRQANEAIRDTTKSGTTLTAILRNGAQLALVHIGDTRAYLLRAGELFQITHDHTIVQAMVDEGRLSEAEAASHPQRAMLLRALDGDPNAIPDLRLHDARPGDRYLLCSDGLSAVVPAERIRQVLAEVAEPEQAVRDLVGLANGAGGPDNVTCVVAHV